jgi:inner membrane protein involved in colicin E2 resistance
LKDQSNKILVKGMIARGLVLIMLILNIIVQNLVPDRERREKHVAQNISASWAASQTLVGPFSATLY